MGGKTRIAKEILPLILADRKDGQRIKCAADYDRVLGNITPAALHEFNAQLAMIKAMLC